VIGLEASRREARKITAEALKALEPFGSNGDRLRQIAGYLLAREF
jgi:hypothetical protein